MREVMTWARVRGRGGRGRGRGGEHAAAGARQREQVAGRRRAAHLQGGAVGAAQQVHFVHNEQRHVL